jgi:hypothetical protein
MAMLEVKKQTPGKKSLEFARRKGGTYKAERLMIHQGFTTGGGGPGSGAEAEPADFTGLAPLCWVRPPGGGLPPLHPNVLMHIKLAAKATPIRDRIKTPYVWKWTARRQSDLYI